MNDWMNVICHYETQLANTTPRYIGRGNSDNITTSGSHIVKVLTCVKGKGEGMVEKGERMEGMKSREK